jgi:hypothetical protein
MPVTARLSKAFYDQLGEQVANELVEWFNQVDFTYRTELRELNDLNFARFDARLEQRVATLEAKIDTRITALEAKLDTRVNTLEAKFEATLERRLGEQAKWFLNAWVVLLGAILAVLASNIALWFRG